MRCNKALDMIACAAIEFGFVQCFVKKMKSTMAVFATISKAVNQNDRQSRQRPSPLIRDNPFPYSQSYSHSLSFVLLLFVTLSLSSVPDRTPHSLSLYLTLTVVPASLHSLCGTVRPQTQALSCPRCCSCCSQSSPDTTVCKSLVVLFFAENRFVWYVIQYCIQFQRNSATGCHSECTVTTVRNPINN